ncbi:hypothetical protein E2C01_080338 [Portunus trituberculatus]|uniref:Uncharacterized protein n=1 Tax=Portunus trituberculatus TaxID=210409 RepID=A0A5B7IVT6_PORTR|nr:hypothetical protein [Portunus trituberculatus]
MEGRRADVYLHPLKNALCCSFPVILLLPGSVYFPLLSFCSARSCLSLMESHSTFPDHVPPRSTPSLAAVDDEVIHGQE